VRIHGIAECWPKANAKRNPIFEDKKKLVKIRGAPFEKEKLK